MPVESVTYACFGNDSVLVDARQALTALMKRGFRLRVEIGGDMLASCTLSGAFYVLEGEAGTIRLRADANPEPEFLTHWRLFVAENAQLRLRKK